MPLTAIEAGAIAAVVDDPALTGEKMVVVKDVFSTLNQTGRITT